MSVTALVSYGALYYSFGAILPDLAAGLDLPVERTAVAFAAASLTGAVLAPAVGRVLDVHGPGRPMLVGALLAVLALLTAAGARTLAQLTAAWGVIGAASALTGYDAAFAAVVRTVPRREAAHALTVVPLVGGLASTVFVPLLGAVSSHAGWRAALLCAACAVLAVNVPVARWLMVGERPHRADTAAWREAAPSRHVRSRFVLSRPGLLLATSLSCQGLVSGATATYLVAGLLGGGVPRGAAYASAALVGAAAVAGRIVTAGGWVRAHLAVVMAGTYLTQGAVLAALAAGSAHVVLALAAGAVLGASGGLSSVARPYLTLRYAGREVFGAVNGTLSGMASLGKAAGPLWGATVLAAEGEPARLWWSLCVVALLSTTVAFLPPPPTSPRRDDARAAAG